MCGKVVQSHSPQVETAADDGYDSLARTVLEPVAERVERVCLALDIDGRTCADVAALLRAEHFDDAIRQLQSAGIRNPIRVFGGYGIYIPL